MGGKPTFFIQMAFGILTDHAQSLAWAGEMIRLFLNGGITAWCRRLAARRLFRNGLEPDVEPASPAHNAFVVGIDSEPLAPVACVILI